MFLTSSYLHHSFPVSRHRAQKGFTVLEAAVAAVIVTVVLSGLFMLQSDMMRMLSSSTETTNASAHLQTRAEQVRLANWPQLTVSPASYSYSALLSNQEMLQVDLSITFPSLGRTRTRAQSMLISPWGISK